MCGCRVGSPACLCGGLVVRGKHYLVLDSAAGARRTRRALAERLNNKPLLAFGRGAGAGGRAGGAAEPAAAPAARRPAGKRKITNLQ